MTPCIGSVLGGFNHKVARRLRGRKPWQGRDDIWVYPPLEDTIVEEGPQDVETYVSHYQNIVAQFISTRTIMDLCLEVERRPGSGVNKSWWEHEELYVEGMWIAAWEAKRTVWR